MAFADTYKDEEYLILSMHFYPSKSLSDAICKLSLDEKAYVFPTGSEPESPWKWRYDSAIFPAVLLLLQKHNVIIFEK